VQRDYRKKRREKGWDEERYIKSKKIYIFYILPVLTVVVVAEIVYLISVLAIDGIQGGTGDRVFFFVILFVTIIVAYILIGATIYNRRILKKLMDGNIQLEHDL
jgi:type III secretory pathway component EscS